MSKWQKCSSCGKAFLKKDIQNGVCIVCSAGSIPSSSGAEDNSSDSNFVTEDPSLQGTTAVGREPQNASTESQKTVNRSNSGAATQISGSTRSNLEADKTPDKRPTFSSSVQAINFLKDLNSLVLLMGMGASLIVFFGLWISDNKFLAFVGLMGTLLIVVIGWAVNRVFIGIAQDIRVSRDNSDELLAITKERFDKQ